MKSNSSLIGSCAVEEVTFCYASENNGAEDLSVAWSLICIGGGVLISPGGQ